MKQEDKYRILMQYLDAWMCAKEDDFSIDAYLKRKGVKTIGIYGYGMLGRHLLAELSKADIEVKWVMDKRDVSSQLPCVYYNSAPTQIPIDIDVIINTAITDIEKIEKKFIDLGFDRVIFVGEILSEVSHRVLLL